MSPHQQHMDAEMTYFEVLTKTPKKIGAGEYRLVAAGMSGGGRERHFLIRVPHVLST